MTRRPVGDSPRIGYSVTGRYDQSKATTKTYYVTVNGRRAGLVRNMGNGTWSAWRDGAPVLVARSSGYGTRQEAADWLAQTMTQEDR